MTMTITHTHISMKRGNIGVLVPGKRIRDEPDYFKTEEEAIRCVVNGNKGKNRVHIQFCDSIFNPTHRKVTFNPEEFLNKCNERLKKPKGSQPMAAE